METVKTSHSTKNYVVVKKGMHCYCYSCGVPVARFRIRPDGTGGYIEFGKDWCYSPTTIRHVQWFLTEVRKWVDGFGRPVCVSAKKLRAYVVSGSGEDAYIPVIDLDSIDNSIYCVR